MHSHVSPDGKEVSEFSRHIPSGFECLSHFSFHDFPKALSQSVDLDTDGGFAYPEFGGDFNL